MRLIIYKTILPAGLDVVYMYTGLLLTEAGDLPGFFMS